VGSQSPKPGYKTERASEIAVLRNVDDGCGAYKTVRFVCVRASKFKKWISIRFGMENLPTGGIDFLNSLRGVCTVEGDLNDEPRSQRNHRAENRAGA